MTSLPLSGIVVADFSRILAGPLCTQLLSDAGARVIKIEQAGRGDETRRWGPPFIGGESAYFLALNRNKESITLDLKKEGAAEVARRLIARADVVVQNFLLPQQEQFALSAEAVRSVNPRAVHCSIRGYDRESSEAELPGYDLLAQAESGLMVITGEPGGAPAKVGVALADVLTAHYAANAILCSLLGRERSGEARAVEISLAGAAAASLVNVAQNFLITEREPRRFGNEHPSIVPYQSFRASDRDFVVAVASDRHFELLCGEVLRQPALAADSRFATNAERVVRRSELTPLLAEAFATSTAAGWVSRCRDHGIPAALVQSFGELFAGSAAFLVESLQHPTIGTIPVVGSPLRFDGERSAVRSAPPLLGEHTESLLFELGFDTEECNRLREEGAV